MGLLDFVKDAGEKIFRFGGPSEQETNQAKAKLLREQVNAFGLKVDSFNVDYDDGVATLKGATPSQQEKEKVVLLVGNTQGVARVDDQLVVEKPEPQAAFYTVRSGDSLSKIAKAHYGDGKAYMAIFEANKPMLKDPDKIYPGQVLRIPPRG